MIEDENAAAAREIIDANLYMVLATADADGIPWASPVYFAPHEYHDFFWVSRPEARHSRNISARDGRAIAIVVFDSSVPAGAGRAVYMSAVAREVPEDDRAAGLVVFSSRSLAHGAGEWTEKDVLPPAELRLYQATATEHYILGSRDERIPVTL
jgi:nitroimidazol reductase NimA-like FMN-containing flavoprotein (pyridoxamine 5'-phosphate oxidase superfamily)